MNAARADQQAAAEAAADPPVQQQFLWAEPGERAPVESPARRLQSQLRQSWAAPSAERWSARRSLVVIFTANAVLWTAVVAGVGALIEHGALF